MDAQVIRIIVCVRNWEDRCVRAGQRLMGFCDRTGGESWSFVANAVTWGWVQAYSSTGTQLSNRPRPSTVERSTIHLSQPNRGRGRGAVPGEPKGCQSCRFLLWLPSPRMHPKEVKAPLLKGHSCPNPGYYKRCLECQVPNTRHWELAALFREKMKDKGVMSFEEGRGVQGRLNFR